MIDAHADVRCANRDVAGELVIDRTIPLIRERIVEVNVVRGAEIVSAVLRRTVTAAAGAQRWPCVGGAGRRFLVDEGLRAGLQRPGECVENSAQRGDVVHADAGANRGAIVVGRTIGEAETRHEAIFVGGAQRSGQAGLAV